MKYLMKIVLDTNVLISGMLNPSSPPGQILNLIISGKVQLAVDDRILMEYSDVLYRNKFDTYFTRQDRENIIVYLYQYSYHINPVEIVNNLDDPGDICFLEVALTSNIPIVTGNVKHFPKAKIGNCLILTPRQFIDRYQRRKHV